MKWKFPIGLLTALALMGSAQAARSVPVQVDGELLPVTGQLEQGVTYVPLRTLLDQLGGWTVSWDSRAKEAVAVSGGQRLTADPDGDTVTLGSKRYSGRVYVENGRTYIPLRTVSAALGGSVEWDRWLGGAAVTSAGADHDAVELYWLSRIISAESRGEPMKGQMAVGNVVLNRVRSREFPDTIPGVVFDRVDGVQFEPVENGTVYQAPTAASLEAARRVLSGEVVLADALYFYAPALSQGTWINGNREYLTTIGCHRFYR